MNRYDKIRSYITGAANQDFILAHLPVISTYMPQVVPSFLFIVFNLYFPDCSDDFADTFYPLFACSIVQAFTTVCYFHISFYSENSPCWDKVGYFVHQLNLWTSHLFIPITVNCLTYSQFKSSNEGKTAYNILFVCYSIVCVISAAKFVYYFKRTVVCTYIWYRSRHNSQIKIADTSNNEVEEGIQQPKICDKNEVPFLSYQMGAGEGKRKLGTFLHLQQDTYAVLFCGLVKSEYKEAIENRGHLYSGTDSQDDIRAAAENTQDFVLKKD